MINIRKRNNLYEYRFEVGKVNGKRKQISKSGFKTKRVFAAGIPVCLWEYNLL